MVKMHVFIRKYNAITRNKRDKNVHKMNITNLPKLTPFLSSRKTRIGNYPERKKNEMKINKNKYIFGVIGPHESLLESKVLTIDNLFAQNQSFP